MYSIPVHAPSLYQLYVGVVRDLELYCNYTNDNNMDLSCISTTLRGVWVSNFYLIFVKEVNLYWRAGT